MLVACRLRKVAVQMENMDRVEAHYGGRVPKAGLCSGCQGEQQGEKNDALISACLSGQVRKTR